MEHDIIDYAKNRYTTKAYDASKKISAENVEKIKALLRYSASSTNAQPWHFILASTQESKARIVQANEQMYPMNNPAIRDASHVVIFCSRLTIEADYFAKVLAQEEADGRFAANPVFKEQMDKARKFFVNIHKHENKDLQHWMDKQVYLNVGQFLLGVAALGIDATAMEGIDTQSIDQVFGLTEKGYKSLLAVTLGYRDEEKDFNATLPKSRLPYSEIFTEV